MSPAAQQASSQHIMPDTREYNLKEFQSGFGAAFINVSVTFPINKLMFRQQLHGIKTRKAIGQLQHEGLRSLYRGLLPPLMQKTASMSVMFGMFDHYNVWLHRRTNLNDASARAFAAMMAGSLEALLCPFERIQVLMQDKKYHRSFKNTLHASTELRTYGFREYYRGFSIILFRNGPSNVAFFLMRKPFKEAMPNTQTQFGNLFEDFISGGLLGATISTVFYPLNVVKTRMQSRLGGEFTSMGGTFRKVFAERDKSWRKMFRGVHVNYTRSMLSWGIINASYEIIWKVLSKYD